MFFKIFSLYFHCFHKTTFFSTQTFLRLILTSIWVSGDDKICKIMSDY